MLQIWLPYDFHFWFNLTYHFPFSATICIYDYYECDLYKFAQTYTYILGTVPPIHVV